MDNRDSASEFSTRAFVVTVKITVIFISLDYSKGDIANASYC